MDELYHMMEQELANSELDVNKVTKLMHISRTKLYYKVKGLTGENPSVFFKTYKLNRAATLIVEGKVQHLGDCLHDGIQHPLPLLNQLQEAIWMYTERI